MVGTTGALRVVDKGTSSILLCMGGNGVAQELVYGYTYMKEALHNILLERKITAQIRLHMACLLHLRLVHCETNIRPM